MHFCAQFQCDSGRSFASSERGSSILSGLYSCSCWMIHSPLFCPGVLCSEDPSVWASVGHWNPAEDAINPFTRCTTMTSAGLPQSYDAHWVCTYGLCAHAFGLFVWLSALQLLINKACDIMVILCTVFFFFYKEEWKSNDKYLLVISNISDILMKCGLIVCVHATDAKLINKVPQAAICAIRCWDVTNTACPY